jgi:hypothetical protein
MTMYRLDRALVLRTAGVVVVAVGVLWLVFVVAVAAGFESPPWLTGALVGGTAVLPLVIAARMTWPNRLLELTPEGYRIWAVGEVGQRSAAWRQVESVATEQRATGPVLVLSLTDGSRSALPGRLLGRRFEEAQREIHDRLDTAHGYRRLDGT